MGNALTAFALAFLIGAIFYGILWWQGDGMGLRFAKWYFIILFVVSMIVGIVTLITGNSIFE
ncbi:hypothetical protein [Tumebacillus lipolyticus]|uniref:Uncharacterized protein n=1 Tax=Tumebacillus lipolyticus TaxID=1280370 RepID=A0ABW4ZYH0_9BACL